MPTAEQKPRTRWGSGRIAVTAKWPEVSAALALGWPLTMIFEKHFDPSKISYGQFRRQVHRLQKIDDARIKPSDGHTPTAFTTPSPQSGTRNVSSTRNQPHRHTGDGDPAILSKLIKG
jgi:hypothetical protein